MKIMTDNVDIEMTMEEFESILDKGMLDMTITIIASLSERMGAKKPGTDPDEELTSLLNEIFRDSEEVEDPDMTFDSYGYNDDDEHITGDYDEMDEDNETVNRIYRNIFGNGEKHRE